MQLSLLVMTILAFTQVITRYVLKIPTVWVEETTRYFMVWLVFIGMAVAMSKKGHLAVEVVEFFAPPAVARKVSIFLEGILVLFGVVFSGLTLKVVLFQQELGQVSPAMQIPMSVIFAGIFVGGVLFTIHAAVVFKNHIQNKDGIAEGVGEEVQP